MWKEVIECPECDGRGGFSYSCCGDDITNNDIDLCPTCMEHCGAGDFEECDMCEGEGTIIKNKKYVADLSVIVKVRKSLKSNEQTDKNTNKKLSNHSIHKSQRMLDIQSKRN